MSPYETFLFEIFNRGQFMVDTHREATAQNVSSFYEVRNPERATVYTNSAEFAFKMLCEHGGTDGELVIKANSDLDKHGYMQHEAWLNSEYVRVYRKPTLAQVNAINFPPLCLAIEAPEPAPVTDIAPKPRKRQIAMAKLFDGAAAFKVAPDLDPSPIKEVLPEPAKELPLRIQVMKAEQQRLNGDWSMEKRADLRFKYRTETGNAAVPAIFLQRDDMPAKLKPYLAWLRGDKTISLEEYKKQPVTNVTTRPLQSDEAKAAAKALGDGNDRRL